MDLALIKRLIQGEDPLQTLYEALVGEIWTAERFAAARRSGDLHGYLREGEHAASRLEGEAYAIYQDLYGLLEAEDPRRDRVEALHRVEAYTLLLIDGLSLRELPLIQEMLRERVSLSPASHFISISWTSFSRASLFLFSNIT